MNGTNNEDLRIAIIGAGMGGLACALAMKKYGFKTVEVYESASNLGFVGAGIQLAPNMARILDKLGCWANIEKEATKVKRTSIREGTDNRELASIDLTKIKEQFGYDHMVGHRSNLAGSIYEACKEENVAFFFSTTAETIKSFGPKPSFVARPRRGEPYIVEADVVLAADGVKSNSRVALLNELGVSAEVEDTGQSSYRIMLKREQMEHDPELKTLIDADQVTRWVGEKKHIIAYPVDNKNIYNISTAHPDTHFAEAPSATYTTRGSKTDVFETYAKFSELCHRMLDLVPDGEVCEWKLRVHAPMPAWILGSVALVGDACHPTLPHLNQGAAQAVEDAAVLAIVLSKCPDHSPQSINKALQVYQHVRKDRAELLIGLAAANGKAMQLGEGAAKEERDRQFAAFQKNKKGTVPDRGFDADTQKMIWGHDCMKVADETFDETFASLQVDARL
ncbi:MAG: hypothetical protein M1820_003003 [Bogoriella megaspora]|nr:MAG: hypothetical protein M1820_003003 [Bogoriella megaspora]